MRYSKKSFKNDFQLSLDLFGEVVEAVTAEPAVHLAMELAKELLPMTPVASAVTAVIEKEEFFVIGDQLEQFGSVREKIAENLKALAIVASIRNGDLAQKALSADQKFALARYTGWGGAAAIFKENGPFQAEQEELRRLVSDQEFAQAKESLLTAYYTPAAVIRSMWDIVSSMGFAGGKVIETSAGVGHFVGLMPLEMRENSFVTMVEPDSLSATIANVLYPAMKNNRQRLFNCGIENVKVRPGTFDLAISNVPFGNFSVFDKRFKSLKAKIHDYFFVKGLDLVRPGGIVAFVTTSGTLDKTNSTIREHLADAADLVTALRLPNETFEACAGTSVVTDIIVLRKKLAEQPADDAPETRKSYAFRYKTVDQHRRNCVLDYRNQYSLNEVFVANPQLHLGKARHAGVDQHGKDKWVIELPQGKTLAQTLATAIDGMKERLSGWYEPVQAKGSDFVMPAAGEYRKSAFFFEESTGALHFIDADNEVTPQNHRKSHELERLTAMTRLRETLQELIEMEAMDRDGTSLRRRLNLMYDQFVVRHGNLLDAKNKRLFGCDDSAPLLWSLEIYNEEKETYSKAQIFTCSTVSRSTLATQAESMGDAISLSYNHFGRLDVDFVATAMNLRQDEVIAQLLQENLAYEDPVSGDLVDASEYLSGNVRQKLVVAKQHAETKAQFMRNVQALEPIVPQDIPMAQISVQLGASWIKADEIAQFAYDLFFKDCEKLDGEVCKVAFIEALGNWVVEPSYRFVRSVRATSELGTARRSFFDLLQSALNQQPVTVHDEEFRDGKTVMVVNAEQTTLARDKAEKIQLEFVAWAREDEERRNCLERRYNDIFNSTVSRTYDGSHLTVPGLNPAIKLRAAQKDGIWRGIVNGNTLYAHDVGAGKTLVQICLAQELKRLGIAAKPTLVVPNHMLEAFAGEYLRAFPRAKVLAASKESLEGDKRRLLMMRIATGNWDAVIVTHSSFTRWSLSPEFSTGYVDEVMLEISLGMLAAKAAGADSKTVREIERSKKSVKTKLKALTDRSDKDTQVLPFDKIGVDYLIVDEADLFKNMWFFTKKTRVAGINNTASLRAFDMFLKTRAVFNRRGDSSSGVVFATATPISNSVAEMFIMQKYLQEDRLKDHGVGTFDSWATNFGRTVTSIEVAPDGSGYRMHTRFCKFDNLPELMSIFREVADIKTEEMLNLPTPELAGGKHHVVAIPASDLLRKYVGTLVERAEAIRRGLVEPQEDNMLKITSDGRKAALDLRCIDPDLPDLEASKVNACCQNVLHHWQEGKDQKLTQLVFCDFSTPSNDRFSAYIDLQAKLVAKGIPADEIAFAQDYTTDSAKAKLHRMVRVGKVRVLIGSTELMGFGTNVQDLLIAEHHLDAPWRPRDVKQRDGRIKRQGNRNPFVWIYRYVTESSFDSYQWQTLETKSKFIGQVMTGEGNLRSIEDVNGQSLSYAEVKAIASGNPMVIEKTGIDNEVAKLFQLSKAHSSEQMRLRRRMQDAEWHLRNLEDRISEGERVDVPLLADLGVNVQVGMISGRPSETVGEAIMQRKAMARLDTQPTELCRSAGFKLMTSQRGDPYLLGPSGVQYECGNAYGKEAIAAWLPTMPEVVKERITAWKKSVVDNTSLRAALSNQIGKPFEYQDRLDQALARQAEIDASLGLADSLSAAQETTQETVASETETEAEAA